MISGKAAACPARLAAAKNGGYMKGNGKELGRYALNAKAGRLYVAGIRDSGTNKMVWASRHIDVFNPDYSYFDWKENLPYGTRYVDCETGYA